MVVHKVLRAYFWGNEIHRVKLIGFTTFAKLNPNMSSYPNLYLLNKRT